MLTISFYSSSKISLLSSDEILLISLSSFYSWIAISNTFLVSSEIWVFDYADDFIFFSILLSILSLEGLSYDIMGEFYSLLLMRGVEWNYCKEFNLNWSLIVSFLIYG